MRRRHALRHMQTVLITVCENAKTKRNSSIVRLSRSHVMTYRSPLSREHREALESRIHHLESQLAAHVNAPMHGMEGIDETMLAATNPTDFNWATHPPPAINLDATFANAFDAGAMTLSPVPSFFSGTTRASSPDLPPTSAPAQFASIPPHLLGNKASPSPSEPHTAPSWEFMAQTQLGPKTAGRSRSHSRNTSNSSGSYVSEDQALSAVPELDDDLMPFAASAPRLPRHGVFAPSPAPASTHSSYTDRSRAVSTVPLPSRFEAETLTAEFIQYVESHAPQAYAMDAGSFAQLCEMVYPKSQKASPSSPLPSLSMARFHVFAVNATTSIVSWAAPTEAVDECANRSPLRSKPILQIH